MRCIKIPKKEIIIEIDNQSRLLKKDLVIGDEKCHL